MTYFKAGLKPFLVSGNVRVFVLPPPPLWPTESQHGEREKGSLVVTRGKPQQLERGKRNCSTATDWHSAGNPAANSDSPNILLIASSCRIPAALASSCQVLVVRPLFSRSTSLCPRPFFFRLQTVREELGNGSAVKGGTVAGEEGDTGSFFEVSNAAR